MFLINAIKKLCRYFGIPFYTVIGGAPQDDEYYVVGYAFSFDEALDIAKKFVAKNPVWFEAEIRNIDGTMLYSIGTI